MNLDGNINLIGREPRDGRSFDTKGEDPILAGKITAAHINNIRAQYIIGGIKHFSFNDQESGRTTLNAVIDERAGRETDLLAFEIGVKDSNVQSVMCSYNLTNGQYGCENDHLLNDVLKGDWKFPGFLMSERWATHSPATAAANNGLDQEQPNQQYFGALGTAASGGQVSQMRLDNMVHRILRAMYAAGLFDNPQTIQPIPASADTAVAQEAEENGAVQLKNANGRLPLNASTVPSIPVIGYKADTAVLSGGGSAQPCLPGQVTTALQDLYTANKLQFHGSLQQIACLSDFRRFLRTLFMSDWVVYAKPPFGGPDQVLKYLARYMHRVAISNYRLVNFRDGQVSFLWRDYAHGCKRKIMTLSAHEFLLRFLLHVLPGGLVRIRHFGLFANRKRGDTLARCRISLDAAACMAPPPLPQPRCPSCSGIMLIVQRLSCAQLYFRMHRPVPPRGSRADTS